MTGELLTVDELRARLRKSRTRFYEFVKKNPSFPAPMRVFGTRPLYDKDRVEAWLDAQAPPAPGQG